MWAWARKTRNVSFASSGKSKMACRPTTSPTRRETIEERAAHRDVASDEGTSKERGEQRAWRAVRPQGDCAASRAIIRGCRASVIIETRAVITEQPYIEQNSKSTSGVSRRQLSDQ